MLMKFNIKSWKAWAMLIYAVVFCGIVVAGTDHFLPPFPIDLDEHPMVENVMELTGGALLLCGMVLSIVGGRQLPVTWARRLFWLNLISLILFVLMTSLIWFHATDWMPFIVKLIAGPLDQLCLFVCFWSLFFGIGMISQRTLRRLGFHILFVATPPISYFIWLWLCLWNR